MTLLNVSLWSAAGSVHLLSPARVTRKERPCRWPQSSSSAGNMRVGWCGASAPTVTQSGRPQPWAAPPSASGRTTPRARSCRSWSTSECGLLTCSCATLSPNVLRVRVQADLAIATKNYGAAGNTVTVRAVTSQMPTAMSWMLNAVGR